MSASIPEQIQNDLKQALKEGRTEERNVLRTVMSELKNVQIEKDDFSDEDAISVLTKLQKQRKQSAEEYRNAGRDDLAEQEDKEAEIIAQYLPEAMSEEDLEREVDTVIAELGDDTDLGSVMKNVMPRVKGKVDGSLVQEKVREKLGFEA